MREPEQILIQADIDYHKLEKDGNGDLEGWSSFVAQAIEQYVIRERIQVLAWSIDKDNEVIKKAILQLKEEYHEG